MNNEVNTAATMRRSSDTVERQRADSGGAPYSALPASPTLTNPDMILPEFPDYDDNTISLDHSQSPLTAWKNAQAGNLGFDLSAESFIAGPITPTTPIIYGNGTMLSDIGEVTEVESTCGPSRSRSGSTRSELAIVTSTALPYEAIKQRIKQSRMAHQRHMSVDSNSTVTAHDQTGLFADFDDAVSIDDSNFQGDDEDSVADSYIDDASVQETISPAKDSLDPDDARYSTTLSRRAEQILANAKRRLTTMEGNLNRARSSISSPSWSSMGSHSTPSPPVGRPTTATSLGKDGQRKAPHGHNRVSSESSILGENRPTISTQRSLSALGTSGGYRRPLQGLRNTDYARNNANSTPSNNPAYEISALNSKMTVHVQDRPLEPLREGTISEEKDILQMDTENAKPDVHLSPVDSIPDKNLKRSASSTQMRDLKDQVNDLKGRLSTLRDQARADSLKRRSLQSLRTPSPFTHARVEQWYAESNSHEDGGVPLHGDSVGQTTTENSSDPRDQMSSLIEVQASLHSCEEPQLTRSASIEEPAAEVTLDTAGSQPVSTNLMDDAEQSAAEVNDGFVDVLDITEVARTDDGYQYAEADDFYESASESGASTYHDTVQAQISHEDREDAFDYEHFFLHSAMGSMSRRRMRHKGSNDSFSSDGSVETTRGPIVSQPTNVSAIKTGHRSRRGSAGSTSTMESFATATEGRHTRVGIATPREYDDEHNDEYDDEYSEHIITLPVRARTHTPDTARRMVFSPDAGDSRSGQRHSQLGLHRRPQSSAAVFQHRSSVSSISSGTNRTFPLINRSKENKGILTPGDSPDHGLKQISETIMSETASICEKESLHDGEKVAPMQMLDKYDQILVERLVASLGRCVLGLSESGHASAEGREFRGKIEAACRALEKLE
ncbi:hypothetical protein F5B22DRAFT_642187 [Xylaria bambusicola]|uniref:uncharacterized protein n=1 Tax=Xylaria bambusicola TaxID=326684 RepID=UPI0020072074|nr:uncharacterized protein F5B22DRAFT_642187 [Xylaria bambusicola]KAI0526029.1 hypothetical protein F5B22DRAFT_642187 [Xylaria bambusicola]